MFLTQVLLINLKVRVVDTNFKKAVIGMKCTLKVKDHLESQFSNKTGVAMFSVSDQYKNQNATIIINDEFQRFVDQVYSFVLTDSIQPIIPLQPYQVIRLNFTDRANNSIRNMVVKLWMRDEASQIGNTTTSVLGSAVWFVPKKYLQLNATNTFYFKTFSSVNYNLMAEQIVVDNKQPWFEKKYVMDPADAKGTLNIKLWAGNSSAAIPAVKLLVYMGSSMKEVRTSLTQGLATVVDPSLIQGAQITVAVNDPRFVPFKKQFVVDKSLMAIKVTPYCLIELLFKDSKGIPIKAGLMHVTTATGTTIQTRAKFRNQLRVFVPKKYFVAGSTNKYTIAVTDPYGGFKEYKQTIVLLPGQDAYSAQVVLQFGAQPISGGIVALIVIGVLVIVVSAIIIVVVLKKSGGHRKIDVEEPLLGE